MSGMALEIREATSEDASILAELNGDVQAVHAEALPDMFKKPSVDADLIAWFGKRTGEDDQLLFIAYLDGVAAGYVYAELQQRPETEHHPAKSMIYIHHLSVRPQFQRKGVGRALLDHVKDRASHLGIERMALDVWTFNENARTFFDSYGLTTYNEKKWLKI